VITNQELAAEIGNRLKAARENRGEKQGPVAHRAGCAVSELSQYENGRKIPELPRLRSLAAALEVPIESLVP
jgi:transcriptional regulator with XRE-family HTH domain